MSSAATDLPPMATPPASPRKTVASSPHLAHIQAKVQLALVEGQRLSLRKSPQKSPRKMSAHMQAKVQLAMVEAERLSPQKKAKESVVHVKTDSLDGGSDHSD